MTAIEICLALYAVVMTALYLIEGKRAHENLIEATRLRAFCRELLGRAPRGAK